MMTDFLYEACTRLQKELEILEIPFVNVGIGRQDLLVYVLESIQSEEISLIPTKFQGIPIRVRKTSEFVPF